MLLPDPETCRRLAVDVAPRWIWMPGMLARRGLRVFSAGPDGLWLEDSDRNDPGLTPIKPGDLPDLTDPLTAAGALLVARAVWGLHDLRPIYFGPLTGYTGGLTKQTIEGGYWGLSVGARFFRGATELEATIAAILAAPEK